MSNKTSVCSCFVVECSLPCFHCFWLPVLDSKHSIKLNVLYLHTVFVMFPCLGVSKMLSWSYTSIFSAPSNQHNHEKLHEESNLSFCRCFVGNGRKTEKFSHLGVTQAGLDLTRYSSKLYQSPWYRNAFSFVYPTDAEVILSVQCANADILAGWSECGSIFVADVVKE